MDIELLEMYKDVMAKLNLNENERLIFMFYVGQNKELKEVMELSTSYNKSKRIAKDYIFPERKTR